MTKPIRQGDITGFDDAEVIYVDAEDVEENKSNTRYLLKLSVYSER